MPIVASYLLPHPAVAVPEIGKEESDAVIKTVKSYRIIASEIASLEPDTIVVMSPHCEAFSDYFQFSDGEVLMGSFSEFGVSSVALRVQLDKEFTEELASLAKSRSFPAGSEGNQERFLDHGTMVPLYFINQQYTSYKLVRCGISGLSLADHYALGALIKEVADRSEKKVVFIASSDLSHVQSPDGPYGYRPEGPRYDKIVKDACKDASFDALLKIDRTLLKTAETCGHKGLCALAGTLDGHDVDTLLLSHEAPFGVGYAVCGFKPKEANEARRYLDAYLKEEAESVAKHREGEDPYVKLAREAVETFIRTGAKISPSEDLPSEMLENGAGVFVSIRKFGQLRGCIGTAFQVQDCIASEIIENAINAAKNDARFPELEARELDYIYISVDVIHEHKRVQNGNELDPKNLGLMVKKGNKQAILLPDLDDIVTAKDQIAIAKKKAGINPSDRASLSVFKVSHHC